MLQGRSEIGLGYDMRVGKAAHAAEDPFNHKPLLVEDPKHPGKVVLTKDALQRRAAYKTYLKRHPRMLYPTSSLTWQDASQDPVPSKTYDSGAYTLARAGVKV